jgi:hypothetical protein
MRRDAGADEKKDEDRRIGEVRSAELEPIAVVERELTRPDGTTVVVEVPVYPPFRLSDQPGARKTPPRIRSAPSLKRKRGGNGGKAESGAKER